jgi:hypothetical protein
VLTVKKCTTKRQAVKQVAICADSTILFLVREG